MLLRKIINIVNYIMTTGGWVGDGVVHEDNVGCLICSEPIFDEENKKPIYTCPHCKKQCCHMQCVHRWFQTKPICPCCNQSVVFNSHEYVVFNVPTVQSTYPPQSEMYLTIRRLTYRIRVISGVSLVIFTTGFISYWALLTAKDVNC